ncbi:MAG: substrate-binding domain-containing protein [Bryobacteraceae bacterium]
MKAAKQEVFVGSLLLVEILLLSLAAPNFFSVTNFFECIRLGVEIGLLTLALTPVIITGGIDLSVGSMMGLCAVSFGALWHDAGWPIPAAASAALCIGIAGGLLNGSLIARLNVSPLIVTLGTYSLFRGLAEGLTGGARNYSGFPAGFLFLGQGYLGGIVPTQTVFLVVAVIAYFALQHRTVVGRALRAVGYSGEGARYAAIPVARRLLLVYALSGFAASVAAIVYVAHLGQAKSDAGNGYELTAITAVVLGGTSIFGGSGTIPGSLLGITAIVVLQNGLRLAALPAELAGILTGVLLVVTIALERFANRARPVVAAQAGIDQESIMKNSQLAILCAAVLAGAVIVSLSNWYLVKNLRPAPRGRIATALMPDAGTSRRVTVGVMPKAKGDPYFISCRLGAEEAAQELNVDLIWDGPTGLDAAKQNEVIEGWITRHVDAIAVSVENAPGISTVLRKARAQGIKVVTWDADAEPDSRDYFINQATPEGIGNTLTDEAAKIMHDEGEFAVITGALSAANQNKWIDAIRARAEAKYPKMKLAVIRPSDDDRDKAFSEAQTILKVYPKVRVIIAISAPSVPGAGEAIKQSGRADVKVVGLSLPNLCKPYVRSGDVAAVVLWKTRDLGYLVVATSAALARDQFPTGQPAFIAGRLGSVEIRGSDIILGAPFVFTKQNIDQFDF